MPLKVVGIDPGFANVGLAAVKLLSPAGNELLAIDLVCTSPSPKKKKLAAASDEVRRLTLLADAVRAFLDKHQPDIVVMEVRPWGKSAKAVGLCALFWGMVFGICNDRGVPLEQIEAQEIKRTLTGKKTASKEDVFAEIKRQHPDFTDWPDSKKFEHVADAAGAAISSRCLPLVRALLSHGRVSR